MAPGLLLRSRLLTVVASGVFAISTIGAGCSTTPPSPTVSGKNLAVYLSAPSNLAGNPQAQDVIDGEKLAFTQLSGSVRGYTLRLQVLTASKISDNARAAIEDKDHAVAYLGEVTPGASIDSLGITNGQDLLQVSPAQGPSVPTKDFESYSTYGRTFASMAPGSDQAAQAILGGSAGKAFASDFRSTYGHAPSTQAILGYAATAAVLKALEKAGSGATNRGTVRDDFFALKGAKLVAGASGQSLGTYTVNKGGTVTVTPGSG
jgi:hypothetical protein